MKWNKSACMTCVDCQHCSRRNIFLKDINHAYCKKHNSNIFNIYYEICIDYADVKYDFSTHEIHWDDEK
jgi:hypothetical protein